MQKSSSGEEGDGHANFNVIPREEAFGSSGTGMIIHELVAPDCPLQKEHMKGQ